MTNGRRLMEATMTATDEPGINDDPTTVDRIIVSAKLSTPPPEADVTTADEAWLDVTTADGKYRIVQQVSGELFFYRHGEPWDAANLSELRWNKMLLTLAHEVAELRAKLGAAR